MCLLQLLSSEGVGLTLKSVTIYSIIFRKFELQDFIPSRKCLFINVYNVRGLKSVTIYSIIFRKFELQDFKPSR